MMLETESLFGAPGGLLGGFGSVSVSQDDSEGDCTNLDAKSAILREHTLAFEERITEADLSSLEETVLGFGGIYMGLDWPVRSTELIPMSIRTKPVK